MSNSSLIRLSGLVFVVLLVLSTALFGELMGAFGDPDHVFEDYYSKAGNRWGDIAGAYILTFAALAFLVFSSALQAHLMRDTSATLVSRLAGASGIIFSAILIVAAAALSAVSLSITFGEAFDDERPFNSGYALIPQLGAVLMVVMAPLVASLHIALLALAGRGRLSSYVTGASLVCAFALLFSILYLPQLALPAWVLLMVFRATSGPRNLKVDGH